MYNTLGEFLKIELSRRDMSNRQLAIGAGVAESVIRNLLNHGVVDGAKDPDPRTLRAVADFLNIDALKLFRLAGYVPPPPNAHSVRGDILAEIFDRLPNEKQDAVLGVIEAFTDRASDHDKVLAIRYPDNRALDGFDLNSAYTIRYIANKIVSQSRATSAQELERLDAIDPDWVVAPQGITWKGLPDSARKRALGLAKAKLNLDYDPTMVDPEWRK